MQHIKVPLGVLSLFCFAQLASTLPQFGYPVHPSVGNRPSYSPNPSGSLLSQIVPPGKPWPANPQDYNSFSQTTQRPNVTPLWATTVRTTQMPAINDRLPDVDALSDHKRWSRPTIIFHQPFLGRNATTTSRSELIEESTSVSSTIVPEVPTVTSQKPLVAIPAVQEMATTTMAPSIIGTTKTDDIPSKRETPIVMLFDGRTSEKTIVPIRLPDIELYTSAPIKQTELQQKSMKDGGNNGLQIGVANLLPEGTSVTIPKTIS